MSSSPPLSVTTTPKPTATIQQQQSAPTNANVPNAMTTPTPAAYPQYRSLSDSEEEDEDEEEDWVDPVALVPRSTTTAHVHDEYENLYRLQGIYGLHDTHSRLDTLIQTLKQQTGDGNNNGSSHLAALQELAEILSVSNEETLAGTIHCRDLVVTLLEILKGSPSSTLDHGMDEQMMLAMLAEDPMMDLSAATQGGGQTTEKMILACQCLSNLLDALPPAASIVVANNGVPVLCDKLEPSDYIDLQEQALYVSKEGRMKMIIIDGNRIIDLSFLLGFGKSVHPISSRCCTRWWSQCSRQALSFLYDSLSA